MPVIPQGSRLKNISGEQFGRWFVVSFAGKHDGVNYWNCKCECGTIREVANISLRHGTSHSCGCLSAETNKIARTTHGRCRTPEYTTWAKMKERCLNHNCRDFHRYGGRGITVCRRWLKFKNFFADMGPKPSRNHSLDRINNSLGYRPGNCRWALKLTQANNTRTNRFVTYNGETHTIAEWSRLVGIKQHTLRKRLLVCASICDAFTTPLRTWPNNSAN